MTDPDETGEPKERTHTRQEYDRHEGDLEPLDPAEVVSDAMEFFTAGDEEPGTQVESPSSP